VAMRSVFPFGMRQATEDGGAETVRSGRWLALRESTSNRLAVIGFAMLVFFLLFSFVGPLVYDTNQNVINLVDANQPPSGAHPLGTDANGLDQLGRLMKGGQTSLEIGLLAAVVAVTVGALWGAVAGLANGVVDSIMMRVVDVFLSVPFLFVVLILAVKYVASVPLLSLVIGASSWQVPARLVHSEVLMLREREFVSAARMAGVTRWRLIIRHLLPNTLGVVVVNVTFQVADAILAVAYVGFLGFGLHFPDVDWGAMLSDGVQYMQVGYWWLIYPAGACIVLSVVALNFIGDAWHDAVDVRLRRG
jgi:ABC-type dipeptide/oligopeptide/nickel transport system permease subunit